MNYLKQLWQQFHLNDEQSSCSDKQETVNSPEYSGEFQVIEIEEDGLIGDCLQEGREVEEERKEPKEQQQLVADKQQQNITNHFNQNQNQEHHKRVQLAANYLIIDLNHLQSQSTPKRPTSPNQRQNKSTARSASTIQMDQYYMIVDSEELSQTFKTEKEWEEFYQKVKEYHKEQVKWFGEWGNGEEELLGCEKVVARKSQGGSKAQKISLTFKDLNSILQIPPSNLPRRHSYWSTIAKPPIAIRFKQTQLANKKDPKRLQQNVNKIMEKLVPNIIYQIADKKYKQVENVEDELEKWRMCVMKVLTMYGANDRQIGYSKGLEYLVVGLMVSVVNIFTNEEQNKNQQLSTQQQHRSFYSQIQTYFKYLMFTKNLRNMYFPGTPKLYPEIQCLTELMRAQTPAIYLMLQDMKVEFIKLFINYYKSFLMYKLSNPQVIRKIMELLIIYGLDLVRIVVIRVLARQEKMILEKKNVQSEDAILKYIAEKLVVDYFGQSDAIQVSDKFKNLFILDTGL